MKQVFEGLTLKQLIIALAILPAYALSSSAATVVYLDRNEFLSELSNIHLERFDRREPDFPISVTSDNGRVSAAGVWRDQLDDGSAPTVWSFASPFNGFGGFFNLLSMSSRDTGIRVTIFFSDTGFETLATEIPPTQNRFWGFISDKAFTSVQFTQGTFGDGIQNYTLDQLTIGVSPVAAVPLPSGLGLLGLAIGAIACIGRRYRVAG